MDSPLVGGIDTSSLRTPTSGPAVATPITGAPATTAPTPFTSIPKNAFPCGNIKINGIERGVYFVVLDQNGNIMDLPSGSWHFNPATIQACQQAFQELVNHIERSTSDIKRVTHLGIETSRGEIVRLQQGTTSVCWKKIESLLLTGRPDGFDHLESGLAQDHGATLRASLNPPQII